MLMFLIMFSTLPTVLKRNLPTEFSTSTQPNKRTNTFKNRDAGADEQIAPLSEFTLKRNLVAAGWKYLLKIVYTWHPIVSSFPLFAVVAVRQRTLTRIRIHRHTATHEHRVILLFSLGGRTRRAATTWKKNRGVLLHLVHHMFVLSLPSFFHQFLANYILSIANHRWKMWF